MVESLQQQRSLKMEINTEKYPPLDKIWDRRWNNIHEIQHHASAQGPPHRFPNQELFDKHYVSQSIYNHI